MARRLQQATIDEDRFVEVKVRIPMSLHRMLTAYCTFRGYDPQTIPLVTRGVIRAYFVANDPFQKWLRQNPETLPGTDATAAEPPPKARDARSKAAGEQTVEDRG